MNRLAAPAIVVAHGLDFATFALLVTLAPTLIRAEANGVAVATFRVGGLLGVLALKAAVVALVLSRLARAAAWDQPSAAYLWVARLAAYAAVGVGVLGLASNLWALASL
jgi:hypothetical protein